MSKLEKQKRNTKIKTYYGRHKIIFPREQNASDVETVDHREIDAAVYEGAERGAIPVKFERW